MYVPDRIDLAAPGRLISGSKSMYLADNPGHSVYFNANLVGTTKGKVWYGDVDLDREEDRADLVALAKKIEEPFYILREMDGRFQHESSPLVDRAVAVVHPDGEIVIHA